MNIRLMTKKEACIQKEIKPDTLNSWILNNRLNAYYCKCRQTELISEHELNHLTKYQDQDQDRPRILSKKKGKFDKKLLAKALADGNTKIDSGRIAGSINRSSNTVINQVTHKLNTDTELQEMIAAHKQSNAKDQKQRQIKLQQHAMLQLDKDTVELNLNDTLKALNQIDNTTITLSNKEKQDHPKQELHIHALEQSLKDLVQEL